MSFTDGKPMVCTERDCKAPWAGVKGGSAFRCRLCGHRFVPGDVARFVFANGRDSKSRYGNFFTCTQCDGPDIMERAVEQEKEAETRFWWFRCEP